MVNVGLVAKIRHRKSFLSIINLQNKLFANKKWFKVFLVVWSLTYIFSLSISLKEDSQLFQFRGSCEHIFFSGRGLGGLSKHVYNCLLPKKITNELCLDLSHRYWRPRVNPPTPTNTSREFKYCTFVTYSNYYYFCEIIIIRDSSILVVFVSGPPLRIYILGEYKFWKSKFFLIQLETDAFTKLDPHKY